MSPLPVSADEMVFVDDEMEGLVQQGSSDSTSRTQIQRPSKRRFYGLLLIATIIVFVFILNGDVSEEAQEDASSSIEVTKKSPSRTKPNIPLPGMYKPEEPEAEEEKEEPEEEIKKEDKPKKEVKEEENVKPKEEETPKEEPKKDEKPKEEPKEEEKPKEEPKKEEKPKEEPKEEETPKEEPKKEEKPKEEPKEEETPKEEPKKEETPKEEAKEVEPTKEATIPPAPVKDRNKPEQWGEWLFYDGDEENRPKEDYCGKYPNRDVPGAKLPNNAWQGDAVYVNHFLEAATQLVHRAKEAIFEEYGHGLPRTHEETAEAYKMFHLNMVDLSKGESPPGGWNVMGGWTTQRSFNGLARRLLHAMITKDTFTVVMGGHSAAAAHGNHFSQSYMMQFHQLMDPIFDLLGMKLITTNQGQGGLGTMQGALGSRSIYGDEIDFLAWDSHMTEGGLHELDLFYRQSLLGSNRPPFLLCLGCVKGDDQVIKALHESGGADIGELGSGMYGIPETKDPVSVSSMPWATQYMKCSAEMNAECGSHKYSSQCWVERDDIKPPKAQQAKVGGAASWHPGFRTHQLTGRVLSMWILQALEQAIEQWQEVTITEGDPLGDEHWHMTEYYARIKKGVLEMKDTFCEKASEGLYPKRVCNVPMYGRTEYTPRRDPANTSIRSIMKPAPDGYLPEVPKPIYEGDDVPNPALKIPDGKIDVLSIVSAVKQRDKGRQLSSQFRQASHGTVGDFELHTIQPDSFTNGRRMEDSIIPGRGWSQTDTLHANDFCDGSINSAPCGRGSTNDCLLSGHNDGRGGIIGDGLSGWFVVELKDMKEGLIILGMDFWHGDNARTTGWTEVNDGKRRNLKGRLFDVNNEESTSDMSSDPHDISYVDDADRPTRRRLDENILLNENVTLEFAIDGEITTLTGAEYLEKRTLPERVVQLMPFLDDPNWSKKRRALGKEGNTVEFAFRARGCDRGKDCSIHFSHIYWA